ncbi:MAG: hypothetical protein J3Q66DRAFT_382784 [Benniella sp.]|nr:MAG: hypothetical protein J3Q66DRAFT_382784 [Benniella sp.]
MPRDLLKDALDKDGADRWDRNKSDQSNGNGVHEDGFDLEELILRDYRGFSYDYAHRSTLRWKWMYRISGELPIRSLTLINIDTSARSRTKMSFDDDDYQDGFEDDDVSDEFEDDDDSDEDVDEDNDHNNHEDEKGLPSSILPLLSKCPRLEKLCITFDLHLEYFKKVPVSFLRTISESRQYDDQPSQYTANKDDSLVERIWAKTDRKRYMEMQRIGGTGDHDLDTKGNTTSVHEFSQRFHVSSRSLCHQQNERSHEGKDGNKNANEGQSEKEGGQCDVTDALRQQLQDLEIVEPQKKREKESGDKQIQVKVCKAIGRLTRLRELRIDGGKAFKFGKHGWHCLELTLDTGLNCLAPLRHSIEKLTVSGLDEGLSGRKEVEWMARNWIHYNNSRWLKQRSSLIPSELRSKTNCSSSDGRDLFSPCPTFKELIGITVKGENAKTNVKWLQEQCPRLSIVKRK